MRLPRRTIETVIALVGLAASTSAAAQTIPRHDVSVLLGWSTANRPRPNVPYDAWIGAWFGHVTGGWYWSDHQKIEVTVGGSTERMHSGPYDYTQNSPLSFTTRSTSYGLRSQIFSGAELYQFFHNSYTHPFVGAGLEVDRERWRSETVEDTYVRRIMSPIVTDELVSSVRTETGPDIRLKVRAFALAGLKTYFNERTFFRADITASAGRAVDRFSWRVGGGFDF